MIAASILNGARALCFATLLAWAAPAAAAPNFLSGEWAGSYTCYQGLTALTLTIERDGDRWSGIFAFGPDKANKGVPRGSYQLNLREIDGRFDMQPGAWMEQPEGYVAVALQGTMSADLHTLSGEVDFEGCETFETRRISPLPAPPPPKTK